MGSLFVRNVFYNKDETLYKVFEVVYIWASSRAIRCDIVPDTSCSSFICSLKQLISVNGVPDLYVSDNMKCFTGRELKDYISTLPISWCYILEVSSWWEGFWQWMVPKNFIEIKTYVWRTTHCYLWDRISCQFKVAMLHLQW